MPANNDANSTPSTTAWDSAPIIGFTKCRAVMRPEKEDVGEKGNLQLVSSGLQFTGTSVVQVPYEDLKLIFDVRGTTNRFGITTRSEATYYFKTSNARGFVAKLNELRGNPSLRKTGGVPGTPSQVAGLGVLLVLAGPGIIFAGIACFIIFIFSLLFVFIIAFGIVLLVLGIRVLLAAKHAASTGPA